jgi:N6-adenosine-specific RNA methylase IME4
MAVKCNLINQVKVLMRWTRNEHSVKPKEVREAIERMFLEHDRIELFAREKPEKWDVWGLDVQGVYENSPKNLIVA